MTTFGLAGLLLFVLGALALPGLSASFFTNPCLNTSQPHLTQVGSLQGQWNGTCSRLAVRVAGSKKFRCTKKPDTYPFFIVFNGTNVGFIVNGTTVPIGQSRIVNTQIIETNSMLVLLNINSPRGGLLPGVARVTVSCRNGHPVYTENDVHSLANGGESTIFPVPLKRDTQLWCNDRNVTVNEHPPGYYSIVCTASRVGSVGATWP